MRLARKILSLLRELHDSLIVRYLAWRRSALILADLQLALTHARSPRFIKSHVSSQNGDYIDVSVSSVFFFFFFFFFSRLLAGVAGRYNDARA